MYVINYSPTNWLPTHLHHHYHHTHNSPSQLSSNEHHNSDWKNTTVFLMYTLRRHNNSHRYDWHSQQLTSLYNYCHLWFPFIDAPPAIHSIYRQKALLTLLNLTIIHGSFCTDCRLKRPSIRHCTLHWQHLVDLFF